MMRKMGPMKNILRLIPGMASVLPTEAFNDSDKKMGRIEAIILSMTLRERTHPHLIDSARIRRIAKGSGTSISDVENLLRQFHGHRNRR